MLKRLDLSSRVSATIYISILYFNTPYTQHRIRLLLYMKLGDAILWSRYIHLRLLVTMFIFAIRYLLRDSTAISQCKRHSLFRTAPISTRTCKCKDENLMDYCSLFVENSSMNDTYRYISNTISRLVLFLIRMLI